MTDVATAEAVVALDADDASGARARRDERRDRAEPVVLGIDLGTTEVKAGLVALDGPLLGLGRAGLPDDGRPRAGLGGAGPGRVVVRGRQRGPRAPSGQGRRGRSAVGVDGHGPTLVAVDDRGEATRAAITWLDTRAVAEADDLDAATGLRGWALGGLPAALWVERHEPAVATATRWYLDHMGVARLPARREAGAPLVPDQLVPDPTAVDRGRASRPGSSRRSVGPASAVGRLTPAAADALGLRAGIPVVGGTVDAFASYHGAGLLEPGDAYDPGGSAGGFGVYWDHPVEVPGALRDAGAARRSYSVGAAMAATGRALDWYRDAFLGGTITTETLLAEAAAITARRRRPRLPAVPRRGAIAALGPVGAWRASPD